MSETILCDLPLQVGIRNSVIVPTGIMATNDDCKIDPDQTPVVAVKSTPISSKAVLSWLDREIDAVLTKYCSKLSTLSRTYWPRALRSFVSSLFEKILIEKKTEFFPNSMSTKEY
jgi:hypothetical protein